MQMTRIKGILLIALVFSGALAVAQENAVESRVYRWNELKVEKMETRERRQVLDGGTTHLDRLEIHTSTLQPGKSPHASHTHTDEEELIIVKEGKLKVTIKDKTETLGPGSIAFALPGDEHGFTNGGDVPVTYYVIKYRAKAPVNVSRGNDAGGSFMMDWTTVAEKENEKGSRRNFFDHPTALTPRFEMHVTTLKEGLNSHAPHTHRPEEIILVIGGDATMQIGDKREAASVGDLVFLGSEVPHALSNTGKGSCSYFAFQWQ
jgi:(S)-ureidoglycine aminohydrolase